MLIFTFPCRVKISAFALGHGLLPDKRAWSLGCDRRHPKCQLELRLVGTETESASRDLYTFECTKCGNLEVRGVKVK
jgi:hypothetical protein